jgi:hypothetical protein
MACLGFSMSLGVRFSNMRFVRAFWVSYRAGLDRSSRLALGKVHYSLHNSGVGLVVVGKVVVGKFLRQKFKGVNISEIILL